MNIIKDNNVILKQTKKNHLKINFVFKLRSTMYFILNILAYFYWCLFLSNISLKQLDKINETHFIHISTE